MIGETTIYANYYNAVTIKLLRPLTVMMNLVMMSDTDGDDDDTDDDDGDDDDDDDDGDDDDGDGHDDAIITIYWFW